MMVERSKLHVEGKDDCHAIWHLLHRHEIDCDQEPWPEIKPVGGSEELLKGVKTATRVAIERAVGFVLDADSSLQSRWEAMASRLKNVGVTVPERIPKGGFVGDAEGYKARVGVWLMPDNEREGTLEDFLETLIRESDPLLLYAQKTTEEAKGKGAKFPCSKHKKAVLHTWLAWQANPGLPYGSALGTKFFQHDSPAAQRFVDWFREVFQR